MAREKKAWNLGLPVHITWKGRRGLRLAGLRDYVTTFREAATRPSLIIVHVGTNDIGYLPKRNLLAEIANAIYSTHQVEENVRVAWFDIPQGDILPRVAYDQFPVDNRHCRQNSESGQ